MDDNLTVVFLQPSELLCDPFQPDMAEQLAFLSHQEFILMAAVMTITAC